MYILACDLFCCSLVCSVVFPPTSHFPSMHVLVSFKPLQLYCGCCMHSLLLIVDWLVYCWVMLMCCFCGMSEGVFKWKWFSPLACLNCSIACLCLFLLQPRKHFLFCFLEVSQHRMVVCILLSWWPILRSKASLVSRSNCLLCESLHCLCIVLSLA